MLLAHIDPAQGKVISATDLEGALKRCKVSLTRMEEYNLARKFCVGDFNKGDNLINIEEIYSALQHT